MERGDVTRSQLDLCRRSSIYIYIYIDLHGMSNAETWPYDSAANPVIIGCLMHRGVKRRDLALR